MPTCIIAFQKQHFIRIFFRQFSEIIICIISTALIIFFKKRISVIRVNCSICVEVLTYPLTRYYWSYALLTPAIFRLTYSSESGFIFKEYAELFIFHALNFIKIFNCAFYSFVNFFSRAAG